MHWTKVPLSRIVSHICFFHAPKQCLACNVQQEFLTWDLLTPLRSMNMFQRGHKTIQSWHLLVFNFICPFRSLFNLLHHNCSLTCSCYKSTDSFHLILVMPISGVGRPKPDICFLLEWLRCSLRSDQIWFLNNKKTLTKQRGLQWFWLQWKRSTATKSLRASGVQEKFVRIRKKMFAFKNFCDCPDFWCCLWLRQINAKWVCINFLKNIIKKSKR